MHLFNGLWWKRSSWTWTMNYSFRFYILHSISSSLLCLYLRPFPILTVNWFTSLTSVGHRAVTYISTWKLLRYSFHTFTSLPSFFSITANNFTTFSFIEHWAANYISMWKLLRNSIQIFTSFPFFFVKTMNKLTSLSFIEYWAATY